MELTVRINLNDPELALKDLADAIRVVHDMHGIAVANAVTTAAPAPAAVSSSRPTIRLGARAQKLFDAITEDIERTGESTLSSVAKRWNCSSASLRGTMMNAMRTLNHVNAELPFHGEWVAARNCMVYTAKPVA